jgi:hypothetical protein
MLATRKAGNQVSPTVADDGTETAGLATTLIIPARPRNGPVLREGGGCGAGSAQYASA